MFGVGIWADVQGTGDQGHQERSPYPSPAVYMRWFHTKKIRDEAAFPNAFFWKGSFVPSTEARTSRGLRSRASRNTDEGRGATETERKEALLHTP